MGNNGGDYRLNIGKPGDPKANEKKKKLNRWGPPDKKQVKGGRLAIFRSLTKGGWAGGFKLRGRDLCKTEGSKGGRVEGRIGMKEKG